MNGLPTYDLNARTCTEPDGTVRPLRADETLQFGLDRDPTPVPQTVAIDPATITALRGQATDAGTVAELRATLLATLDALG